MVAPTSSAASATSRLRVSIDTRTWVARASTTGSTRRSSSSMGTSAAPGRVLSPPTSTTSAPSAAIARPWVTAASGSSQRPPSEKESGVTFRTPMTSGRDTVSQATSENARFWDLTVDELERFVACGHAVPELAPHGRRHRERARLAYPPHRHAQVLGLDDHEYAPRLQAAVDLVGDLGGQALLDLGPLRQRVNQAGQLGEPGD